MILNFFNATSFPTLSSSPTPNGIWKYYLIGKHVKYKFLGLAVRIAAGDHAYLVIYPV